MHNWHARSRSLDIVCISDPIGPLIMHCMIMEVSFSYIYKQKVSGSPICSVQLTRGPEHACGIRAHLGVHWLSVLVLCILFIYSNIDRYENYIKKVGRMQEAI